MSSTKIEELKEYADLEPTKRVLESKIYDEDEFIVKCINSELRSKIENEINKTLPKE